MASKREFAEETAVPAKVSVLEEGKVARSGNQEEADIEGPGEFEDAFEDEMSSSEEDIIDEDEMNIDDEEDEEEGKDAQNVKLFLPGQKLGPDEVLEPDASAYIMLHPASLNWPCLSFDFIPDSLGEDRTSFPHTIYMAAGSQADVAKNNEITVVKFSQLNRTNKNPYDSEIDEDEEDEDDGLDDDPLLEHHSINHQGGVNRIRVSNNQNSLFAASWADTGKVYIWDLRPSMNHLEFNKPAPKSTKPIFTVLGHKQTEGYAMDWSTKEFGKLLTGDNNGSILLTLPQQSSFKTDALPFTSHLGSVEDIQWSPTEDTVFASCSVDGDVKIWDTRTKRQSSALTFKAHPVDVNVISWNRKIDYLLASGSDDGNLSIWDMRKLLSGDAASPAANFKWHAEAITSLEWHAQEDSVIAASGADNQLTIWDLSVEADPEEERMQQQEDVQIPPQLLFIHMGQEDLKELHWHQQIPGCMVSTALNGFNIIKTISA